MEKLTIFVQRNCPYCRRALAWQQELTADDPALAAVPVEVIDELEQPALADRYDYYYVPSYFIGSEKLHEGAVTRQQVEQPLRQAAGRKD